MIAASMRLMLLAILLSTIKRMETNLMAAVSRPAPRVPVPDRQGR
jgi:hypothetical protein